MKNRTASLGNLNVCLYCLVFFVLSAFLSGCAQNEMQSSLSGKHDGLPADIMDGHLQRGLSAVYFNDKYKHVNEIPKSKEGIAKFGNAGPPILKLDNKFGKGEIFDSGRSTEVGVLMNGFIHLDRPGKYLFQAMSNDGFQLYIDGNLIVSDPGVHGDRMSKSGEFEAVKGGMFPVQIKYFQRKGTATLSLYWQPPGTALFSVVPETAFSHIPL